MHTLILFLSTTLLIQYTLCDNLLNPIQSFLGGQPYESIVEKDYSITNDGLIHIKNIDGPITIKTGLDKKSVALRVTKRANAKEHLEHMHIIEEEVSTTKLSLRTAYAYEDVKGSLDYVLTVPLNASVRVSTDNGDITCKQIQGAIIVTVGQGTIYLEEPASSVEASIMKQGNITCIQPKKANTLVTHKGTIHVIDSMDTVIAKTEFGKIEISCKTLPPDTKINCFTEQGSISLYLPNNISCSLHAQTGSGIITSEQNITVGPILTKLDNEYWNRIKKEVSGSIGTNNRSSIQLETHKGNIRLLKK